MVCRCEDKDPDSLAVCADALRAAGYAVVTQAQADMWDSWLAESHAREGKVQDELVRLSQMTAGLMAACRELLNGSRPRWWREYVTTWNDYRSHTAPVVGREPRTKRPGERLVLLMGLEAAVRKNDPAQIRHAMHALDGRPR